MTDRDRIILAGWALVFSAALLIPVVPIGDPLDRPYYSVVLAVAAVIALIALRPADWPEVRAIAVKAWPFAVYLAVLVGSALVAGIDRDVIDALIKYVAPLGIALLAAFSLRSERARVVIVVMVLIAGVVEAIVAGVQAIDSTGDVEQVDVVTGTLGESHSGLLTVFTIGCATVSAGLAIALRRYRLPLIVLSLVLPLVGVIAAGRAVVFLAPVALLGLLFFDLISPDSRLNRRRTLLGIGAAAVMLPGLVGAIEVAYPGSTQTIRSIDGIRDYLAEDNFVTGMRQGVMLTEAVDRTAGGDLRTALLGEGSAATGEGVVANRPKPVRGFPEVRRNDRGDVYERWRAAVRRIRRGKKQAEYKIGLQREWESRTIAIEEFNPVWMPRLIVENGILGLAAWVLVLGWTALVALRARRRVTPGSVDDGLTLALPGLAALTLVASAYQPSPVTPDYLIIYWVIVGICLRLATVGPSSARG